jgi:signal transduction histidine kinase/DNA-binding NarL/FixJ family response regulator/ligand-binding sensor domain-containing protein
MGKKTRPHGRFRVDGEQRHREENVVRMAVRAVTRFPGPCGHGRKHFRCHCGLPELPLLDAADYPGSCFGRLAVLLTSLLVLLIFQGNIATRMPVARLSSRVAALATALVAWAAAPAPAAGLPPVAGWAPEVHGGHEQDWFVHAAADGYVYVGNGSGVLVYDGQRWRFVPTPHKTRVRQIAVDADGVLVASTVDDLLRLVADERGQPRLSSILGNVSAEQRRFGDVLGLAVTPAGYYAGSATRLFFLSRDGSVKTWPGRFTRVLRHGSRVYVHERESGLHYLDDRDPVNLQPLPGGEVMKGRNLGFLVGMAEDGLLAYTPVAGLASWRDGRWTPWPTEMDAWLREGLVVSGHLLPDGTVLVGTKGGLFRFSREGRVLARFDEKDGLPATSVTHMARDASGDLWLAMMDGVGRIGLGSSIELYDRRHAIPPVNSVARHEGRLLVAADNAMYALAEDARPGEPVLEPTGFRMPTWSFAHVAGGAELFIAATDGIYRLTNPKAAPAAFRFESIAPARFAYSVTADRRGAPRLFALTDRGLHVIEREGGRWRARHVPSVASSGELRWLAQEDSGALWIGSTNGVATRVEPVDADWLEVRVSTFGAAAGLPTGSARVAPFRGGVIVVTEHGPFALDGSGRMAPDARLKDLPQDRSGELEWFSFAEMPEGELWARIGPHTGRAVRTATGYAWDPAALAPAPGEPSYDIRRDRDGATWIGRSKSLLRVAPGKRESPPLPRLRLAAIRDGSGTVLAMDRALARPSLAPGLSDLRFQFAWPAHALTEGARFRARIEGHEEDFSPWTPEPHRDVGGLWGGRYVLHVEAMDRYGRIVRADPYSFVLPPPWYRTWWAWALWLLSAALGIALIAAQAARWRTRRLLRAQAELERIVDERTTQVRNQAERLEALDVAKSGFFAGVTHEFRTPLTLILEPLRELRDGIWGKLPARASGPLDHIERNAQRVLGLVNQLLDLQSAEAGTLRISAREADLAALARAIAIQFDGVAARGDIALRVRADKPVACWFDAGHLESVVANLLSNAVKFTPPGGEVRLEVSSDAANARLVVENTGPGISPEALPRIFERFYRAPPGPTENARGAGVGLAVVKEIVERHGGRVAASSEPGRGARFEVTLPLGDAHLDETERAAMPAGAAPGAITAGAIAGLPVLARAREAAGNPSDATTVLVVDDNVELREFIAQRLQLDYRVLQAGDGESGLAAAREDLPDVIVTDVNMPRMDGIEMLRQVKSDPATAAIPVIMLASRATVQARAEGFATGADDYIYKPFNTTELTARIAGLIASRSQLRSALVEAVKKERERATPAEDPLLSKVRAAVLANLDDAGFGVAQLAEALHMERTTLFKRLKAIGAPAPVKLVRDIRLDAASRMLREAAGQVTEVAYATGYRSLSHFSSAFTEKFGMSPSEYLAQTRARVESR